MRRKSLFNVIALFVLFTVVASGFKIFRSVDERYPWIWAYLVDQIQPKERVKEGPTHIMFMFACHFEPHDQATVTRWMENYPKMAQKHIDADGKHPQNSWFWHFSQSDDEEKAGFLRQLSQLAYQRYGEIELHLHHYNDDETSFLEKIRHMITLSQQVGAMITAEVHPRTAFGFIHGNWSLDNSRGPGMCGVNNELILLRKVGCYADFTHASWGPMQPRTVNRLYYATDDPLRPKSYDRGREMEVGIPGIGDLLIFEGPIVVRFNGLKPTYDHGDISLEHLPTPERIDSWIKTGIHVKGRPEWVFVKVFAHGALSQDYEAVLGEWRHKLHSYLEEHYNDGRNYVLHYITAREAYNIATAAEAGKKGNPNNFRDFTLPPYANRFLIASKPYEIISFGDKKAVLKFLEPGSSVELRLRAKGVSISGDVTGAKLNEVDGETTIDVITKDKGMVGLSFTRMPEGDAWKK